MSKDEGEKWIVNLIRETRMGADAKIDLEKVRKCHGRLAPLILSRFSTFLYRLATSYTDITACSSFYACGRIIQPAILLQPHHFRPLRSIADYLFPPFHETERHRDQPPASPHLPDRHRENPRPFHPYTSPRRRYGQGSTAAASGRRRGAIVCSSACYLSALFDERDYFG